MVFEAGLQYNILRSSIFYNRESGMIIGASKEIKKRRIQGCNDA